MTVRINRMDQLIGSDWIRKTNPERPTVGRVLSTEGWPPWVGRGLWRKMHGFSLHEGVPTIREIYLCIFFESCWALLITLQKCIRFVGKPRHIIDIGKAIFRLNIPTTTAKYFHTSDITGFCRSLIVSTLISLGVRYLEKLQWRPDTCTNLTTSTGPSL